MNKVLVLVRGIPGSGKSTFANLVWNNYAICEADKFFYDKELTFLKIDVDGGERKLLQGFKDTICKT